MKIYEVLLRKEGLRVIQLQDIGRFGTLPDRAVQIVEGHVPALREAISQGWDIEEEITFSRYTSLRPLHIALLAEQLSGRQAPYRTRSQPE